jgi:hypothetical protein
MELSASELADLAGVAEVEVARLVELGILAARDDAGPFLESDVPKVRLAVACERPGCRWRHRVGGPGGPAVVRVPGGHAVPAMGGAVGADLPAGEPGHRDPPRDARRGAGVDGVRPGRPRRADAGGRARHRATAPARPLQRDLRPGMAGPARPGPRGGPAPDHHRLGRRLPGAVRGTGAGSGRRPAGGHGAGRPAQHRLPAAERPGAAGHLPPAGGAAVDRGPGRAHRARARSGRHAGPGGSRQCCSSTWSATPG